MQNTVAAANGGHKLFHPLGTIRCSDSRVKFGVAERLVGPLRRAKFKPNRYTEVSTRLQKVDKFYFDFWQRFGPYPTTEYKC